MVDVGTAGFKWIFVLGEVEPAGHVDSHRCALLEEPGRLKRRT